MDPKPVLDVIAVWKGWKKATGTILHPHKLLTIWFLKKTLKFTWTLRYTTLLKSTVAIGIAKGWCQCPFVSCAKGFRPPPIRCCTFHHMVWPHHVYLLHFIHRYIVDSQHIFLVCIVAYVLRFVRLLICHKKRTERIIPFCGKQIFQPLQLPLVFDYPLLSMSGPSVSRMTKFSTFSDLQVYSQLSTLNRSHPSDDWTACLVWGFRELRGAVVSQVTQ